MIIHAPKLALVTVAFLGNLLLATIPAQATLIGDTINGTGISLTPGSATIGAGVEFTGINGFINFDFGADTLTLTSNANVGWSGFGNYVFSGFDEVITNLSIGSNAGFSGDLISTFSFTSDSITLDMNLGSALVGAALVYNITNNAVDVPEPSTLALFGTALAGLAALRRRRQAKA